MLNLLGSKPSPTMIAVAVVHLEGLFKKMRSATGADAAPAYLVEAIEGLLTALKRYQSEMKEKK